MSITVGSFLKRDINSYRHIKESLTNRDFKIKLKCRFCDWKGTANDLTQEISRMDDWSYRIRHSDFCCPSCHAFYDYFEDWLKA